MGGWLLDASVLFELGRASPDARVTTWSDAQPSESLFLSAATIAAIRHRSERHCKAELQTEIGIWLDQTLRPWFAGRILPLTEDIVLESMRLRVHHETTARELGHPNLLLAATAHLHALTICARDVGGYLDVGIPAFNPWERVSNPS